MEETVKKHVCERGAVLLPVQEVRKSAKYSEDQARDDHGRFGSGGLQIDSFQPKSPEEIAAELSARPEKTPSPKETSTQVPAAREIPPFTPRPDGVSLLVTPAQSEFIASREQQTDGQRETWDHIASQTRGNNPSLYNVNKEDLKELRAAADDEREIHREAAAERTGEYSAGERATVNGLITKIDRLLERMP